MLFTEHLPKATRKKVPLSTKTLLTYYPAPRRHNATPLKNNTVEILKTRLNHPSILNPTTEYKQKERIALRLSSLCAPGWA